MSKIVIPDGAEKLEIIRKSTAMLKTSLQPPDMKQVTLAVLAGGQGSRMGMPKALLQLDSKPILRWLLDRWRWPGPTMLVSAPSVLHPPGCELFDREVADPVEGLGPLRGVLTALTHLSTPLVAITTVDMPGVNRALLTHIVESLAARPDCDGAMCRVRTTTDERIEPFPAAFRSSASQQIAQRLEAGQRSVRGVCAESAFCVMDFPEDTPTEMWINLNTQADLAAFEAINAAQKRKKAQ